MGTRDRYTACEFYAILSFGGERTGSVICLTREPSTMNGTCFRSISTPHNDPSGEVIVTWTSPVFLIRRCELISERVARQLNPHLFESMLRYEKSPAYRAHYHQRATAGVKPSKFHDLF